MTIPSPFLTEMSMIRFSKLDVAMDKLTSLTVKRNLSKSLHLCFIFIEDIVE